MPIQGNHRPTEFRSSGDTIPEFRSSGDTIPNSVAGALVRALAVWDFLRVVAWVRAFAV